MSEGIVNLFDIIDPFPPPKLYGETKEKYVERVISEYTPKFKETALFNDSMGTLTYPLGDACKKFGVTIDEFCEGYVRDCFEGAVDDEIFDMLPEGDE